MQTGAVSGSYECKVFEDLPLITTNAALKRPAYQSSVYSDSRGSYPASLANDGDRISRCSISQRETNPWWAVDLGGLTTIYRVDFTSRGDYGGKQLSCLASHNVLLKTRKLCCHRETAV